MCDAHDPGAVAVPLLADKAAVCAFVVCRKSRFCAKAVQLVNEHEGTSQG